MGCFNERYTWEGKKQHGVGVQRSFSWGFAFKDCGVLGTLEEVVSLCSGFKEDT